MFLSSASISTEICSSDFITLTHAPHHFNPHHSLSPIMEACTSARLEPAAPTTLAAMPQTALLDFLFPGFSVVSDVVQKYLHVDLNVYIPVVLLFGGLLFSWRYFSEYAWDLVKSHFMSCVDIKADDEIYNMLMAWVATQTFSKKSHRFVANTDLTSKNWLLRWKSYDEDEDENDEDEEEGKEDGESKDTTSDAAKKKKGIAYTPTFGSHWFWYQNHILVFRRQQNRDMASGLYNCSADREEISISCFGRNPLILKDLLQEARTEFTKQDQAKTLIYRGSNPGLRGPSWQRCMARASRPFSTVILNEKVKKDLIDDVAEYLNPATRRWYANRGIPYRRGYLLYGPPGTGKSSLSLALAGHFKMRIYIVSLSAGYSSEETLGELFAVLPRKCVVLLEDIDAAGLSQTREKAKPEGTPDSESARSGKSPSGTPSEKITLSGLLNILDGVASQEGRVLIMTTNHLEKLDKALIRPGRVDKVVKFDRADKVMAGAIFRAIYAPLEGDDRPKKVKKETIEQSAADVELKKQKQEAMATRRAELTARVEVLSKEFSEKMPELEFSPAEIQGYLLKNKRDPESANQGVEEWVVTTRNEKQARDVEDKAKAEEEKQKAEEEEKKKKKNKKKEAKQKSKSKSKLRRKNKKHSAARDEDSSASSEESSGSESESEEEEKSAKKNKKRSKNADLKIIIDVPATDGAAAADKPVARAERSDAGNAEQLDVIDDDGKNGNDSGYGTPQSAEFEKV
jgi:chaperone BCS1